MLAKANRGAPVPGAVQADVPFQVADFYLHYCPKTIIYGHTIPNFITKLNDKKFKADF